MASLNATAEADLSALRAENESLKLQLETSLKNQLEAATEAATKITAAEDRAAKAESELSSESFIKRVNDEAARIVASNGHSPLPIGNSEQRQAVTIEEFHAMPHADRNQYIRSGGKISK
jgi:hypothetical protein